MTRRWSLCTARSGASSSPSCWRRPMSRPRTRPSTPPSWRRSALVAPRSSRCSSTPTGSGAPRARDAAPDPEAPTVLFVGRLSPHKRQDRVIEAFSLYRRHRAPGARLVLVGEPLTSPMPTICAPSATVWRPGRSASRAASRHEELGDRYREADVFLCLSEHEGFCVPAAGGDVLRPAGDRPSRGRRARGGRRRRAAGHR